MHAFVLLLVLSITPTARAGDFEDGFDAYEKKNFQLAEQKWRRTADQGNAFAQAMLGSMLEDGYGMVQNFPGAIFYYQSAAAQGSQQAQLNLALMYFYGKGVVINLVKAHMLLNIEAAGVRTITWTTWR